MSAMVGHGFCPFHIIPWVIPETLSSMPVRFFGSEVMGKRSGSKQSRIRDVIVLLALVSQAIVTLGLPLPAPTMTGRKEDSRPFPCKDIPCGCMTADQCWAGDCCCFTLEEKLAWAENLGIEPPGHVRPMVEARKSHAPCCQQHEPSPPACCDNLHDGCEQQCSDCCSPRAASNCCNEKPAAHATRLRWVVGILAQKCRGEGGAGLFQEDPLVVPDLVPAWTPDLGAVATITLSAGRCASVADFPPVPPPRQL
jgi:hypothetical protein